MIFKTVAYTNKGARTNNEDSYLIDDGIWLIADGLGGHDCGETASEETVSYIRSRWMESKPMDADSLIQLTDEANDHLIGLQKSQAKYAAMRTTLVFAVTDGRQLRYVNVGDSRFYYFRAGRLIMQSEDHSVPAALVKLGQLSYEDIRSSEDRNKLLKVMGDNETLNLKSLPESLTIKDGDAFILCSDGFWEYVYEQEMEIDLAKSESPKEWMNYMLKRLILRVKDQNDNDNFTAICVIIGD